MNLYLAGSSGDMTRVRGAFAKIAAFTAGERLANFPGIHITHDWISVIAARGEANPTNATFHERTQWAAEDLAGVRAADVLWLLMPPGISDGAFYECGYADALGKNIVISGPGAERTIFTSRGNCFTSDEAAYDHIIDTYYQDLDFEGIPSGPRMWDP